LYIKSKSGASFAAGGSGSGSYSVTNENGYGVCDLGSDNDNKMIDMGKTITFKLAVTGTVDVSDIESVEISQRISSDGIEISRQQIPFS
jgi:hypothetical protein